MFSYVFMEQFIQISFVSASVFWNIEKGSTTKKDAVEEWECSY